MKHQNWVNITSHCRQTGSDMRWKWDDPLCKIVQSGNPFSTPNRPLNSIKPLFTLTPIKPWIKQRHGISTVQWLSFIKKNILNVFGPFHNFNLYLSLRNWVSFKKCSNYLYLYFFTLQNDPIFLGEVENLRF